MRARIAPAGLVLLWCVLTIGAVAPGGAPAPQPAPEGGVPVIYRGQEIVRIHHGLGSLGPVERARLASERLNQFVRDPSFDPTRVTLRHGETFSELVYDDRVLGVITDEDAQAAGRPRLEFARRVRDRLVEVVTSTREEFSVWSIALGLGWAALATAILVALLWLLSRLGPRVHARVDASYRRLTADPRVGRAAAARATRVGPLMHSAVVVATAGVAVALAAVWLQVVLQLLPWSRPVRAADLRLSGGADQDALVRLVRLRAEPLLPCRHRPHHLPGVESRSHRLQRDRGRQHSSLLVSG